MSKVAVVYWSGTGNTETMAKAVEEGIKNAGSEAVAAASRTVILVKSGTMTVLLCLVRTLRPMLETSSKATSMAAASSRFLMIQFPGRLFFFSDITDVIY